MVTRKDYGADAVAAARSVLIELTHLLSEYQDDLVIVGGWVPELLLPNANERHVGSLDVDIAIDHRSIPEHVYRTIQELLLSRGYEQGDQPFVFVRLVENILIEVDLLSGEYGGTGRNRRHQTIQEFKARKARGSDLAFELNTEIELTGTLPGGGLDTVKVRVASIVSFIVMKAAALAGRLKEKDAWDIVYCLRNYPGGVEAVVEEIPLLMLRAGLCKKLSTCLRTSSQRSIASGRSSSPTLKESTTLRHERRPSETLSRGFNTSL